MQRSQSRLPDQISRGQGRYVGSHVFGDGMIGSRSLAFLLPHCRPCPPPCGRLTSCDTRFLIAADSQEDDYSVHEGL